MVEHLSEGDINLKNKEIRKFDMPKDGDYYQYLKQYLIQLAKKYKNPKKSGVIIYFDIFPFEETVAFLREEFGIQKSEEEINYGDKFSLALCFDKDLKFQEDQLFFTESGYMHQFGVIPGEGEFNKYEKVLRSEYTSWFQDESHDYPTKFNRALNRILSQNNIDLDNCRFQILRNLESEATNLHSFFVSDLEKAKGISQDILDNYLEGGDPSVRINLDGKKDSPQFNPLAFEHILKPEHYPLGRFPTKTKYSLSLMQQVAVNLSLGLDQKPLRSVNGPPGTGKTTLLKDIFADLIVTQAYDM